MSGIKVFMTSGVSGGMEILLGKATGCFLPGVLFFFGYRLHMSAARKPE